MYTMHQLLCSTLAEPSPWAVLDNSLCCHNIPSRPLRTPNQLLHACRYETIIFIVPPVLAPLLGAVYVRSYGRRSGIMLGCCIMLVGQVGSRITLKLIPGFP